MNSIISIKTWFWGFAIVSGLTASAFASHGHGGGGGHHGGGFGGGHHGGGFGGGHHHGGYYGGHHHGGYYGGYRGGYYGGYRGGYYGGLGLGFGYPWYGYYGSPYGYGYRGYGYGGYGYGGYYSPNYYYSTPVYSYPSTVIVNQTPSASAPVFDNGPIVITAPATNDKPIDYTLNGIAYSIKPGQSQKFIHDRDWIVNFDRGNGQGTATYGLKAATYKFKMTDKGWELFEAATPIPAATEEGPKPIDLVKPGEKAS